jgi:putative transposase
VIDQLKKDGFEVNHLCDALGVSRVAYYQWLRRPMTEREHTDRELAQVLRNVFLQHRRRYGARRLAIELQSMGYSCSRAKVRKIMGKMQLTAIQPKSFKPRTTESRHRLGYSPNLLLEGVELDRCNQVWVGDITYIALAKEFTYMSMLMDLYSRKIVAWSIDATMTEALVIAALRPAIAARQPSPGLIHHSDRGGQYASKEYRAILARAQMRQSMSRAGDCYDNAFMESCFGTIKTELEMECYASVEQARHEIAEYINYYNAIRRHSSLDYQSPTNFELVVRQ